jgi:cyclic pyranopterin phosphate synthase
MAYDTGNWGGKGFGKARARAKDFAGVRAKAGMLPEERRKEMGNSCEALGRGALSMVAVGEKPIQRRRSRAEAFLRLPAHTLESLHKGNLPKGDALVLAKAAGILAAKKTDELLPLCHPLPLEHVQVDCELLSEGVRIEARVETSAKTGVEMEALVAAAMAALTLYDMCKGLGGQIVLERLCLLEKEKL